MTDAHILFGVIVPGLVALLAVASSRRHGEDTTRDRAAFRWPLLLAFVVLLAHWGLSTSPTFESLFDEQWERLFSVPILGLAVGIVMSLTPRWWWLRGGLFAVLAAAVWYTTRGLFIEDDPLLAKILPSVGTFILLCALEPLAVREQGPLLPTGLWIVTGAAAAVILVSGHMAIGFPLGTMSVAFFVIAIFAFIDRCTTMADGALAVAVPTIVTMLDVRYTYAVSEGAEIPALAFALPAVAFLLVWIARIPWLRDKSNWIRIPFAVALISTLSAAAIFIANYASGAGSESDDPFTDMYGDFE